MSSQEQDACQPAAEMEEWQHRRSRLNHDWLKNRFLNRLDGLQVLLGHAGTAAGQLEEFVRCDLPEWERRARDMAALLDSCEAEMSPGVLLAHAPLSLLPPDQRRWLGNEVHRLWRRREPLGATLAGARQALGAATAAHARLVALTGASAGEAGMRAWPVALAEFSQACRRLGTAVGRLPDAIHVV